MANTMFTMKLDTELRDEFMAEAAAADRPAAQIMREFMREFIQKQKDEREYKEFLRRKVEKAKGQMLRGEYRSSEEVEAYFAELRARRLKEAGPNKATRKAISELEAGKGKKFDDVAALMADLHRDDWC